MKTPPVTTPSFGTGTAYLWLTDFVLLHGVDTADALVNVRNRVGNWQGKPAYQLASVRAEVPDAPALFSVGAQITTEGFTHFRQSVLSTNKLLVRLGVGYSNTAGTLLGAADVGATFALRGCGAKLGRADVDMLAGEVGTDINYYPVGDWSPTVNFNKVMAVYSVEDNESNHLEYQLVVRTANDVRSPNLWQTVEAAWANPTVPNSERNSTALSLPAGANATTNLMMQFGLAARKRAAATGNPRAVIRVMVVGSWV
jgi:hypothetical protein